MYGETGDLMRTELAVLLRQHRILHRLGGYAGASADEMPEREAAGMVIQQYRQTILSWCAEAVMAAKPLVFSRRFPRRPTRSRPQPSPVRRSVNWPARSASPARHPRHRARPPSC
jgi:hypothetical protein